MASLPQLPSPAAASASVSRFIAPVAIGVAALMFFGGAYFVVPQTDVAFVKRFGKVVNPQSGPVQPGLHFSDDPPTPGERETAEVVRAAGITANKAWLAQKLECSEEAAAIRLARAAAKGLLVRTGRGLYHAAPSQVPPDATVKLGEAPSEDPARVPLGEPEGH